MDVAKIKSTTSKKISIALAGVMFLFLVSVGVAFESSTAHAQSTPPATTQETEEEKTPDTGTNCAVEKIGWMLCPIIEGSAKLADFAFQFLADHMLSIEPELLSVDAVEGTGKSGTLQAWEQARTLANIMFVIAFIIIVYSQITGSGLNNYGIKRMMPRLILAAIAVNVSYYICQALVDLSNILGYNIMEALTAIANNIGPQVLGPNTENAVNVDTTSNGGILATIAIAALALAGIIWLMLPVLGSIVLFIFITCITIILILLLRKAFIVLLVVASPLAFVMYLLPNTEKYFSKWLDMFWKLLLVFPIVALLMGGGQLASTIILVSGSQEKDPNVPIQCDTTGQNAADANSSSIQKDGYGIDGECPITIGNRQSGMMLGLVAAGVAVAPLLAVWSVLQGALAAAGAIGGKIGGAIQKGSRSSGNGIGKAAKSGFDKSAFGRGLALRKQGKDAYKNERFLQGLGNPDEDGISSREKARRRYTRRAAGGLSGALPGQLQTGSIKAQQAQIQRAATTGAGIVDKREKEEIQNEMAALSRSNDPLGAAVDRLAQAINSGDKVGAKAAQNLLMSSGGKGMEEFAKAITKAESRPETNTALNAIANSLKQNALQNHTGAMKEKYAAVNSWAGGGGSLTNINSGASGSNPMAGLNDEQIAKQTDTSISNGLEKGWITQETADRIVSSSVGENLSQNARASLTSHAAPLQQQRAAQTQSSQSDSARAIGEAVARSINNNRRPPGS